MTQSTRTYIWDIERLAWRDLVLPDQTALSNVITDIHWKLSCVDTITGQAAIVIGATDLVTDSIDPSQFVDLGQVSEDLVRAWLMATMTAEFTQAQLDEVDRRLDQQLSQQFGRPWINSAVNI